MSLLELLWLILAFVLVFTAAVAGFALYAIRHTSRSLH